VISPIPITLSVFRRDRRDRLIYEQFNLCIGDLDNQVSLVRQC